MTPGEHSQIDELRKALDDLTATLKRRNAWRRVVAVLAGIAIAALLVASLANRATLSIVRDATDPKGKIAQRNAASQQHVIIGMLDEGDCRNRRADAGLPAPEPLRSCAAQTPPEVYPGRP